MPKNSTYHSPVLLQQAVHFLGVQPGLRYIDATLGGGGHTAEIIRLGGLVLGFDQDPDAINACPDLDGLTKVHSNFTHLGEEAKKHDWSPVSGILFDLGVSAHQFETPSRGFSFQLTGPLDMRMDPSLPNTAADLVNKLPRQQLAHLFKDYGEIPVAKTLADKIVSARPFTGTLDLAALTGKWSRQAFQALRIAVNDELTGLVSGLDQAYATLEPGGVIVVISFHSLEDRIVKNYFKSHSGEILTHKPILGEKSAKLRAFKKL